MLDVHAGSFSRCLVTGANGFIGSALVEHLQACGLPVRGALRQRPAASGDWVQVTGLGPDTDWHEALQGCDVVVHTAGRAHVLHEQVADPLLEFRRVNVEGTLALAEQALAMGVRRFVFISSIGVNGSISTQPFNEEDEPSPHADYALSKLEAEQALRARLQGQAMELVIVRPPLVYAAHAPGNFPRLLGLVRRGLPLPFALVRNARSMVALENLVDFLRCCLLHPAAANQLFVVADGEDVSTRELITLLATGMQRRVVQLPVPPLLMALGARLLGRQALFEQLCGNLQVDIAKARRLLAWQPPLSAAQALEACAKRYVESKS